MDMLRRLISCRIIIFYWLSVSAWDRKCDWLQTTAEHDFVSAGDHGELSCAQLNREWKFHMKSQEMIGVFGLSSWLSRS